MLSNEFLPQLIACGGMYHLVYVESVHNPISAISPHEDGLLVVHSCILLLLYPGRDAEAIVLLPVKFHTCSSLVSEHANAPPESFPTTSQVPEGTVLPI